MRLTLSPSTRAKKPAGALIIAAAILGMVACAAPDTQASQSQLKTETLAQFRRPWAMTFLPDGRLLVTERAGNLELFDPVTKSATSVAGLPSISDGGQGGLGDVVLHPEFVQNRQIYISYVQADDNGQRGSVVARGTLNLTTDAAPTLENLVEIWEQAPKVSGGAHFGLRLAFGPENHLYITSGERRKYEVAQDMSGNLGKILRVTDDGTPAPGNPFAEQTGIAAQVWTLGNRNPLGIAFDGNGQLWANEMGPAGGDELNLIEPGKNYGYPLVSDGNHYDGRDIPDHSTTDKFQPSAISWNPVISPAGLIFYNGDLFKSWRGNALMGGLSARALIRIEFDGLTAREAERIPMGARIREVEQAPDGSVWVLTDGRSGELVRLQPVL